MLELIIIVIALMGVGVCVWTVIRVRNDRTYIRELISDKEYLKEEVANTERKVRRQLENEMAQRLNNKIRAMEANFSVENADLISQALTKQTAKNLKETIEKIIETKFNRMASEFIGNIGDEADGITSHLKHELSDKIWDSFQAFKETMDDSPHVFCNGVKFAYTKGSRTVFIIEQQPQVRTVSFMPEKLLNGRVANNATEITDAGAHRYTLAFPYVYFVIVFDHGSFTQLEVFFRNKSVMSAREHLYTAPLPNVNFMVSNNPVCMGSDAFHLKVSYQSSIAKQCEMVVSHFWQRSFNGHLGTGNFEKVDRRIKTFATWQSESQKDPLFVLNIEWPNGRTVKSVLDSLFDETIRSGESRVDSHIRSLLTRASDNLTNRIKNEVANAKREGFKVTELDSMVSSLVEEVVLGHATEVFKKCKNL